MFVFDRVFGETVDQAGVWEYLSESVNAFVQGYNVSILAYGQSGAGKSYTMGTSGPAQQEDPAAMGMLDLWRKVRVSMTNVVSRCRPSRSKITIRSFNRSFHAHRRRRFRASGTHAVLYHWPARRETCRKELATESLLRGNL